MTHSKHRTPREVKIEDAATDAVEPLPEEQASRVQGGSVTDLIIDPFIRRPGFVVKNGKATPDA